MLAERLPGIAVTATDAAASMPDAKEAIEFALMAHDTLAGLPTNIPGATGARRAVRRQGCTNSGGGGITGHAINRFLRHADGTGGASLRTAGAWRFWIIERQGRRDHALGSSNVAQAGRLARVRRC